MRSRAHDEFDALTSAAEDAAIHLDGPRLDQAMHALVDFADRLRQDPPDAALLREVRARMTHFIALCRFVSDLLHELVTGAPELTSYAETGRITSSTSTSVLRRYG